MNVNTVMPVRLCNALKCDFSDITESAAEEKRRLGYETFIQAAVLFMV